MIRMTSYNIHADVAGNTLNATYPVVTSMASFSYPYPLFLIGYSLSSAILASGEIAGVIIVLGQSIATLSIGQTTQVIATQVANANRLAGALNPSGGSETIFFDNDKCISIPPNQPVTMYGFGTSVSTDVHAYFVMFTLPGS